MMRLALFFWSLVLCQVSFADTYVRYPTVASGTVTSITAGTGLTGGVITGSGTIALSVPVTTANGGTNATTWTAGSIPYLSSSSAFAQDNANLFWDGTNHRLGLGSVAPSAVLDVEKAFTTTAATSGAAKFASVITAHANNDQLAGIYSNPTFASGGFSGTLGSAAYLSANSALALTLKSDGNYGIIQENYSGSTETMRFGTNGYILADGAGTASAAGPAYGFLSDSHSGWWMPTGSQLAWSTASTERMRLTNTGLGIGTATPGTSLDVGGKFQVNSTGNIVKINNVTTTWPAAQGAAATVLTNSDGAGTLTWSVSNGMAIGNTVTSGTAGSALFVDATGKLGQDNANYFWDTAAKRLGIGTATPIANLDVVGDINFSATTSPTIGVIYQNGTLFAHSYGASNIFIGAAGGNFSLTGSGLTGIGAGALFSDTSGAQNFGGGFNSLHANTTGAANAGAGAQSLISNTTGAQNSGIGAASCYNVTTESNITCAGYLTQIVPGVTNATAIGANAIAGASNAVVLGDSTTPIHVGIGVNTPGASLEIKNGHWKSTQTTPPTAAPTSNAGTGATCTVANATDTAGKITLTTTAIAGGSGDVCDVTFNLAYGVAPICMLTPISANAILDAVVQGVYLSTATTALSINFANTDVVGRVYSWAYSCLETQ